MRVSRSLALAAVALAFAACARMKAEAPAPGQHAAGEKISDAQIVGILAAANDVDIAAGYQAERMASAEPVRSFGQQMVTDHTALNQRGADLASRLGITAEESPISKQLREKGDKRLEERSDLAGAAFDRAYLDDEIALHAMVLQTIDETLLPNARNAELRALITEARPKIASHLEQARTLQARP